MKDHSDRKLNLFWQSVHPDVLESAVIAVPDEIRGEVFEAFVVLHDGAERGPGIEQDLQQWVKTRYAAHAYPRTVHFTDELPKIPSGKVQRFVLRQQRRAELAAAGDGQPGPFVNHNPAGDKGPTIGATE